MAKHPLERIPQLLYCEDDIETEKGKMRPERALIYDEPFLLLHHVVAARGEDQPPLSEAEFANARKTAHRLCMLLQPHPWAKDTILILDFPDPQNVVFTTSHDPLLFDLIHYDKTLVQAEQLFLNTLSGDDTTALTFRRC